MTDSQPEPVPTRAFLERTLAAMEGVIDVADRQTDEFEALRRLLCRLGAHGPEWGGHGLKNASPSNAIVGPGHRRCKHCGAEWVAYEAVSNSPYRVLAWEHIKPANTEAMRHAAKEE